MTEGAVALRKGRRRSPWRQIVGQGRSTRTMAVTDLLPEDWRMVAAEVTEASEGVRVVTITRTGIGSP